MCIEVLGWLVGEKEHARKKEVYTHICIYTNQSKKSILHEKPIFSNIRRWIISIKCINKWDMEDELILLSKRDIWLFAISSNMPNIIKLNTVNIQRSSFTLWDFSNNSIWKFHVGFKTNIWLWISSQESVIILWIEAIQQTWSLL